jgi:hypothetical protein
VKLRSVPINIKEANAFVDSYHRHNKKVVGAKFAIGCSDGTRLIGVAIVGRPIARLLDDGFTAEVTRCCVLPDAQKGACSFLYAKCWDAAKALGYQKLVTYTLASESGASLRGAAWKVVSENRGGSWSRSGREREWQSIYGQLKLRWEKAIED